MKSVHAVTKYTRDSHKLYGKWSPVIGEEKKRKLND